MLHTFRFGFEPQERGVGLAFCLPSRTFGFGFRGDFDFTFFDFLPDNLFCVESFLFCEVLGFLNFHQCLSFCDLTLLHGGGLFRCEFCVRIRYVRFRLILTADR